MSTRRRRLSGIDEGRLMYDARRGDRKARAELDALAAERSADQQTDDPPEEEQHRTPRPDPTQGVRGTGVKSSGIDVGREMFEAGRRPPRDVA